jgi:hypothetical protein
LGKCISGESKTKKTHNESVTLEKLDFDRKSERNKEGRSAPPALVYLLALSIPTISY